MMTDVNWIAVPEAVYLIAVFAGFILTASATLFLFIALIKKKTSNKVIPWLIVLIIGMLILFLIFTGKLVSVTMLGG